MRRIAELAKPRSDSFKQREQQKQLMEEKELEQYPFKVSTIFIHSFSIPFHTILLIKWDTNTYPYNALFSVFSL